MAEPYTPTTEEVLDAWVWESHDYPETNRTPEQFHRWLTEHDASVARQAKSEALREAADRIADGALVSVIGYGDEVRTPPERFLRDEASQIERGDAE